MSRTAVERLLTEAARSGRVPGAIVLARGPDGAEIGGAFGRRSMAAPQAMTMDTVVWIASMTKLVTTVAALQLVAEGRLALETPVAAWLPAFADLPILEGHDAQGDPILRPGVRPVTIRHLLTHTSGLGYTFTDAELGRYARAQGLGPGDSHRLPRRFEAGEAWLYGVNTDWLGEVIAAVVGETLDVYLARRLFQPLGMNDTGFAPRPDQADRTAAIHARLADGGLAPMPFALPPPPHFMMGGGGLYATAPDYLTFLTALMEPGRLLPPDLTSALFDGAVGDLDAGDMISSEPSLTRDYRPLGDAPKTWSLGLLVNRERGPDGRSAGSGAWAGLGNCYYWVDPKAGVAGVCLTQILPFADPDALDLAAAFERAVYS
jgi:CubicO group peptidase (beta-lactamase class C family)